MGTRPLFLTLLLGCAFGAAAADQTGKETAPGAAPDESIPCQTDKDCPVMACGPCTPGSPITKAMVTGPSCAVNPCLDASAVCNAQHRCEIGPRTRKNPAVWGKPSP